MDLHPASLMTYTTSTFIPLTDLNECFICREEEQNGQDELHHFCDCKDLVAHQSCLLKWIQKGTGNEDRQRCKACTAKYHLQEGPVWKIMLCHWKNLLLSVVLIGLMVLVAFTVHQLKTLKNPPPAELFKAAAVCFGVIAETLLIKCLVWYCQCQYSKAKISSYSIKARAITQSGSVSIQVPLDQEPSADHVNKNEAQPHKASTPKGSLDLKLAL
eukprot:XP_002934187.1 PREDICTED: uncharacterized protein LOC100488459 [Xenopus tropicalis]